MNMRKLLRKCLAVILAAAVLTGCSAKGSGTATGESVAGTGEPVSTTEAAGNAADKSGIDNEYWDNEDSYTWSLSDSSADWELPEDCQLNRAVINGEHIYYTVDGLVDMLELDTKAYIRGYSFKDKDFFLRLELSELAEAVKDYAGSFSYLYVDAYCEDSEGNLCFLTEMKDGMGKLSSYLVTYRIEEDVFECVRVSTDFPERKGQIYSTVNEFLIGDDGLCYALVDWKNIYILNRDGGIEGVAASQDGKMIDNIFSYDSSVWFPVIYDDGYYIFRIDGKGEVTERKSGFTSSGDILGSIAGKIAVKGSNGITVYNPETEEKDNLFMWLDVDMVSSDINNIFVISDDCIVVECWDGEDSYYPQYIERKPKSDTASQDREELVVGCMYTSTYLERNVVAFNRSQDKYHVTVKAYNDRSDYISTEDALTNFNLDLVSGKAPDVINISDFDIYNLAEKGAIDDLGKYLDEDAGISREECLESVLDACTIDGILTAMPLEFMFYSYIGAASELGEQPGWTLEDISAYMEHNDDKTLFKYWDRNIAAKVLLSYSMDEFVDWDNGVCDFTSDSFTEFLNILMTLPDEVDYSVVDDRSQAMQACFVFNFQGLQESKVLFGDDYVIKGYPTADGREQHSLELSEAYSIMSGSKHKEGAWEFIKFCLQSDVGDGYFTVNKAKLQAMIDEELAHAGEETKRQFYTSVGVFDYHYATQEEVDEVLRIIDHASLHKSFDDEIINIINEEAKNYFTGIKPVEEVERIIQDRVQLYLDEQN